MLCTVLHVLAVCACLQHHTCCGHHDEQTVVCYLWLGSKCQTVVQPTSNLYRVDHGQGIRLKEHPGMRQEVVGWMLHGTMCLAGWDGAGQDAFVPIT
jgi:hypothetical protein